MVQTKDREDNLTRYNVRYLELFIRLMDVLGFVKKQPLSLHKAKMSDVLSDALDSIFIPDKITLKLPENDAKLLCDKKQLSIVLSNIIFKWHTSRRIQWSYRDYA